MESCLNIAKCCGNVAQMLRKCCTNIVGTRMLVKELSALTETFFDASI